MAKFYQNCQLSQQIFILIKSIIEMSNEIIIIIMITNFRKLNGFYSLSFESKIRIFNVYMTEI